MKMYNYSSTQNSRNSLSLKILTVSVGTATIFFSGLAPAQAGILSTFREILSPTSDLETSRGTRRGGAVRDICKAEAGSERNENHSTNLDTEGSVDSVTREEGSLQEDTSDVARSIVAFAPAQTSPLEGVEADSVEILLAGKTTQEHPKLWMYIPFSSVSDPNAILEFSIFNETQEKPVASARGNLPPSPGLISFSQQRSELGLEPDNVYSWTVEVLCIDEQSNTLMQTASGLIKRINPSELEAIQTAEDYDRYLRQGIWYDVVTHLIESKNVRPQEWQEFLSYFKLDSLGSDVAVNDWLDPVE